MEMLYINIGGSTKISSVYKKIIGQINAFNAVGIPTTGAFLTTAVKSTTPLNKNVTLIPVDAPKKMLFYQLRLKKAYTKKVVSLIHEHPANVIYLRYSFANLVLAKAIKKSSKKIFLERNSFLMQELKALCSENPLRLNLSSFLSKIQDCYIPILEEMLFSKKMNNASSGIVSVTKELLKTYPHKNGICITNGIEPKQNLPRKFFPKIDAHPFVFLILDGTSTPTPWQGVDRLINSIKYHKLEKKIEIRIAGNYSSFSDLKFVKCLGYLDNDALDAEMEKAHIGTGNLCLFRKSLFEASVLKNRAYFSKGLPILYASKDDDLDSEELKKYCFKTTNSEEIIPIPEIIAWLKNLYQISPNFVNEMHDISIKCLSFNVKALQFKQFLASSE